MSRPLNEQSNASPAAADALSLRGRRIAVWRGAPITAEPPSAAAEMSRGPALLSFGVHARSERRALLAALSADRPAAAPDFLGVGASDAPPDDETPLLRHDAAALLELVAESDAPAHLIGHGLGAGPALRAALDQPSRVASLTLISPFLLSLLEESDDPRRVEAQELAWSVSTQMSFGDVDAAMGALAAFWGGPSQRDAAASDVRESDAAELSEEARAYARASMGRAAAELRGASAHAPGALTFADTALLQAPSLILCPAGARPALRASAARLRGAWPGASFSEIGLETAPERAAAAIRAFLKEIDGPGATAFDSV